MYQYEPPFCGQSDLRAAQAPARVRRAKAVSEPFGKPEHGIRPVRQSRGLLLALARQNGAGARLFAAVPHKSSAHAGGNLSPSGGQDPGFQKQQSLGGQPFLRRCQPPARFAQANRSGSCRQLPGIRAGPKASKRSLASCPLPIAVASSFAMAGRWNGPARLDAALKATGSWPARSQFLRRCCEG